MKKGDVWHNSFCNWLRVSLEIGFVAYSNPPAVSAEGVPLMVCRVKSSKA